jgi:hypothetical protein
LGALTPGFRPDHILVAEYQLPLNQHPSSASVDLFNHAVIDRLAGQPGIVAVGITDQLPASDPVRESAYTIEGLPADSWKIQFAMLPTSYGHPIQ